jgi:hypothetical protein
MSEEPPEDTLPEGYGIEPLPYISPEQPQQTSSAMEEAENGEASQSVSEEITQPLLPVVPPPVGLETVPPQKKSRRTLWIASGVIGILLLIIASIVIIDISHSTPDKTLGTFCSALQGGDYRTAYEQFSPKLRGVISETAFATIFVHDKVTGCTYSAINETGNSATAGLELVHASNGMNRDGIMLARDDKNGWLIDDFYRQT